MAAGVISLVVLGIFAIWLSRELYRFCFVYGRPTKPKVGYQRLSNGTFVGQVKEYRQGPIASSTHAPTCRICGSKRHYKFCSQCGHSAVREPDVKKQLLSLRDRMNRACVPLEGRFVFFNEWSCPVANMVDGFEPFNSSGGQFYLHQRGEGLGMKFGFRIYNDSSVPEGECAAYGVTVVNGKQIPSPIFKS